MNISDRLAISYYKTIATLNEEHHIYLVQHQESKKIFIKKILDVYNINIYERLKAANITGIPKIYHTYEENNQLTVIEEYISGTSLLELMESSAPDENSIIGYICELCDILGKIHWFNPPVIHRDIKPSNIIITPYNHVILIDFNAAKYLTNEKSTDTVLLGTKGYAAPEQYGFGCSTPQTDIYALGILLKEMTSPSAALYNKYESIISRCTQINPADRFKDVFELKNSLLKLKESEAVKSDIPQKTSLKSLIPPGYRTKTPWKMCIASIGYLIILWLCLNLQVENATILSLWIQRLFSLAMMLSVVFGSFNYCDIQRFLPLCKSRNKAVHYIGIILLDLMMVFSLLIIMTIFVSAFFGL